MYREDLRTVGEQLLKVKYELFEMDLQKEDYHEAELWLCEYEGAADMLRNLRLISIEEYTGSKNALFTRWLNAKYPKSC